MTKQITSLLLIAALVAVVPPMTAFGSEMPTQPNSNQNFNIEAAGATFPYPLIDLWRVEYKDQFNNVNLNYQSIGSGGGVKQHISKTVNFAASDAPLKTSESEQAPGTLHIPEAIGGVVLVYNIPEVPQKGLKLTGDEVADIFLGKITKWNDPRIQSHNPGLSLPDEEIVAAHRSDGSGTTFIFTDYLVSVSSEFDTLVGKGKSVPWIGGVAAAGNEGVAGIVKSTPYSIGYVELAYAFQTGMPFAYLQNADGNAFIEPSIESISAASKGAAAKLPKAEGDWSQVSIVSAPGKDSYPIASFTYLLVYNDLAQVTQSKEQAQAVIHLIHWMITDGQQFSPQLLYVPLADSVVELGKQGLSQITYNGEKIWDYTSNQSKSYNIPDWIRNSAKWWADGAISDEEYINGLQYLIKNGILVV